MGDAGHSWTHRTGQADVPRSPASMGWVPMGVGLLVVGIVILRDWGW